MGYAIEHGSTRLGRWLRDRRFRLTLWIAAIEGLLYVFHVLHWWAAVLLAVIAVLFWWYSGRQHRSDALREASWIFAVSQLLVLVVPLALKVFELVAIVVVGLLAVVALVFLFKERS